MNFVICVVVLFFTVLNLVLYHKLFDVYYFSLGNGLAKEIGASVCVAIVETALVMYIGGYVLAIFGIIVVIALIVKAIKKFTGGSEAGEGVNATQGESSTTDTAAAAKAKMNELKETITSNVHKVESAIKTEIDAVKSDDEKVVQENSTKTVSDEMFCPHCGEKILRTAKFCSHCGKANSLLD